MSECLCQVVNEFGELHDKPVNEVVIGALERVVHPRNQLPLALRAWVLSVLQGDELDRSAEGVAQFVEHFHRRQFANALLVELEAFASALCCAARSRTSM